MIAGLLLACAHPPDAELFARALDARTPATEAERLCERLEQPATADECRASIVRLHDELGESTCHGISDERWAGECWFTLAERRAAGGDRWAALEACGHAGPFYDECLYHLWVRELQNAAHQAKGPIDAVESGRRVVGFWRGLQTVGPAPEKALWGDFWYFNWNEHRPADLATCAALPPAGPSAVASDGGPSDDALARGDTREGCEAGTRQFVLRSLVTDMLAPGVERHILDRICRSGQIPSIWTEGLYISHPALDAQAARAAALACTAVQGKPVRRWNPVFTERRGAGHPIGAPGMPATMQAPMKTHGVTRLTAGSGELPK